MILRKFLLFFVLINFKLSVKHFSLLTSYFMQREDSLEKRRTLKLTLNFRGRPSDTASTFLKMASADGYFLYEDDFDVVITIITGCKRRDLRRSNIKIKKVIANDPHVL